MTTQQRSTPPRNVQPIIRGAIVGFAVAIIVSIGLSLGRMLLGEPFILTTYLLGAALAGAAWSWNFRWREFVWRLGVLVLVFSIGSMILTGQYWLALGALALIGPIIIVVPSIYKLGQQMKRRKP